MANIDETTPANDTPDTTNRAGHHVPSPLSLEEIVQAVESLSPADKRRLIGRFSPSKYAATNPPTINLLLPSKVYSAPRRFDLSTIFVVTAAYAVLLGTLRAIGASPVIMCCVAAFFTAVAFGQALLFNGQYPRLASVLSGMATLFVIFNSLLLVSGRSAREGLLPLMIASVFSSVPMGIILGYVAGAFVGGVFLVADIVRNWRLKHRKRSDTDDDPFVLE
jgi:hypothetical protein